MIARLLRASAVAAAVVIASSGTAHADAAGPTDYRTDVVAVTPATPFVEVTVEGGDAFIRIEVAEGHEVVVLGYLPDEEPYLRITANGTVERNLRSYATYYNEERFGGGEIPDVVDTTAAPQWERVGGGGSWAWHDHRAHWMGDEPPIGLEPGDSLPADIVPLLVDGERVDVEVVTTLLSPPSFWPPLFGVLIGLQLVLLGLLAGPATSLLATAALSAGALVVGVGQYRSLPAETGPLHTWWLVPAIALVCTIAAIGTYGRSHLLRLGLVALAALQLLVWSFRRRAGLTAAIVPTDLPFWFDRAMTAAVLAGSVALLAIVVRELLGAT